MARLAKAGAVRMGCTLASLKAVFLCDSGVAQEGLGASARRCPFRGPSAKVIQLPDIQFSKSNRGDIYPSTIHPEKSASDQEIL